VQTEQYQISFDDHGIDDAFLSIPQSQICLLKEGTMPAAGPISLRRGLRVAVRYNLKDTTWHLGTALRRLAGGSTFDWVSDDGQTILKGHPMKLTRVLVEAHTSDGWKPARITRVLDSNKYHIVYSLNLTSDAEVDANVPETFDIVPETDLRLAPLDDTAKPEGEYKCFCSKGHEMVRSTFSRFGYEKGFWCDECRVQKENPCERWYWYVCSFDFLFSLSFLCGYVCVRMSVRMLIH
jgi:hypothetical protein